MLKSAVSPTPNTTTVVAPTARNRSVSHPPFWIILSGLSSNPSIPAQDRASATRRSGTLSRTEDVPKMTERRRVLERTGGRGLLAWRPVVWAGSQNVP
jgi:hypothetical protein